MNEMHEKGGIDIKTSGVARTERRIADGDSGKRPRRVPRDGTVRVSPTTIGRPNPKNRRSVDQKTSRTGIGATIGRPNRKNGQPVDQKNVRRGSVPHSAGRTGKTASLLIKRLLERGSV